MGDDDYDRQHETKAERLDRNWNELLQELRVSQTGVQILTGFLLTMPLQPRFAELGDPLRWTYMAAVVLCLAATCVLIAPVSLHRALFRQQRKASLVKVSSLLAKVGLTLLALAVSAVAALVFGIVLGEPEGHIAGVVSLVLFGLAWLGIPLVLGRDADEEDDNEEELADEELDRDEGRSRQNG